MYPDTFFSCCQLLRPAPTKVPPPLPAGSPTAAGRLGCHWCVQTSARVDALHGGVMGSAQHQDLASRPLRSHIPRGRESVSACIVGCVVAGSVRAGGGELEGWSEPPRGGPPRRRGGCAMPQSPPPLAPESNAGVGRHLGANSQCEGGGRGDKNDTGGAAAQTGEKMLRERGAGQAWSEQERRAGNRG